MLKDKVFCAKHKIVFSKKHFKERLVTKRAKLLYIISCIFQVHIIMPEFECRAQKLRRERLKFAMDPGEAFEKGFKDGLTGANRC